MWCMPCLRKASTGSSTSAQMLLTSDLVIPESMPSAVTKSSTARSRRRALGLNHHRMQGVINRPARLQDHREE
jgi:hypothetical protein